LARNLTFSIDGNDFELLPKKIDRNKLYGWSEVVAIDDEGEKCNIISMDETGTILIPKGGLGLGILSSDGSWVERNDLKAVALDGKDIEIFHSSYKSKINLDSTISPEEFLNYSITFIYQLKNPNSDLDVDSNLINNIKNNIYTFKYANRDSYEPNQGFLIEKGGVLFLLVGYKNEFEMLSLNESAIIEEDSEVEKELSEGIDFSMF